MALTRSSFVSSESTAKSRRPGGQGGLHIFRPQAREAIPVLDRRDRLLRVRQELQKLPPMPVQPRSDLRHRLGHADALLRRRLKVLTTC